MLTRNSDEAFSHALLTMDRDASPCKMPDHHATFPHSVLSLGSTRPNDAQRALSRFLGIALALLFCSSHFPFVSSSYSQALPPLPPAAPPSAATARCAREPRCAASVLRCERLALRASCAESMLSVFRCADALPQRAPRPLRHCMHRTQGERRAEPLRPIGEGGLHTFVLGGLVLPSGCMVMRRAYRGGN
eukprot:4224463-Pleurochrysis_carterae.AAC.1